jgi:hypothetical protein
MKMNGFFSLGCEVIGNTLREESKRTHPKAFKSKALENHSMIPGSMEISQHGRKIRLLIHRQRLIYKT